MTEDQVMKVLREAGFDSKEIRALTFTSWKDGIDIERPAFKIMRFVELIEKQQRGEGA